ncbi:MAG: T6SS phospholipase effector Tle1-like catalytic domain-containing protein [Psychrobacter sp.]|uniref:T6SS phospholipase effector Tle1-like catalytic domain-containing protein n=1 Tax=unclassified Psychrobacter TaxID=196806 RepID=UPI00186778B0|nr:DUF2235 domain-containing protein [Psychrobacter sp. FME61]
MATGAKSNTREGSKVDHVIESLTINVFFDGTNNNLYNVGGNASLGDSYANDFSNVARLFQSAKDADSKSLSIYVEGIGTDQGVSDSTVGFAFGSGTTGITSRADEAFTLIKDGIKEKFSKETIHKISFNVFGFSRGAATARHFVYHLNTQSSTGNTLRVMKSWGVPVKNISVNLLGIFDTVSSYDNNFDNYEGKSKSSASWEGMKDVWSGKKSSPNFDNDTTQLALKISKGHARRVFHICAQDEYRLFFSLTNINSAKDKGFGYEVYLPGAHSDIGGGYNDFKGAEKFDVTRIKSPSDMLDKTLFNWFKSQGFFDTAHKTTNLKIITERYVARGPISNAYGRVHFKTMRLMAEKESKVIFKKSQIKSKETISSDQPDIKKLMNSLPANIIAKAKWGVSWKQGFDHHFTALKGSLPHFRHRYVHWSSKNAMGYDLRRGVISGNDSDLNHLKNAKLGFDQSLLPIRKIING